jgi:hypothetical protein
MKGFESCNILLLLFSIIQNRLSLLRIAGVKQTPAMFLILYPLRFGTRVAAAYPLQLIYINRNLMLIIRTRLRFSVDFKYDGYFFTQRMLIALERATGTILQNGLA